MGDQIRRVGQEHFAHHGLNRASHHSVCQKYYSHFSQNWIDTKHSTLLYLYLKTSIL